MKKKQKIKAIRQLQFFSRTKKPAITTEKIVVRSELPKQPHYYQGME